MVTSGSRERDTPWGSANIIITSQTSVMHSVDFNRAQKRMKESIVSLVLWCNVGQERSQVDLHFMRLVPRAAAERYPVSLPAQPAAVPITSSTTHHPRYHYAYRLLLRLAPLPLIALVTTCCRRTGAGTSAKRQGPPRGPRTTPRSSRTARPRPRRRASSQDRPRRCTTSTATATSRC